MVLGAIDVALTYRCWHANVFIVETLTVECVSHHICSITQLRCGTRMFIIYSMKNIYCVYRCIMQIYIFNKYQLFFNEKIGSALSCCQQFCHGSSATHWRKKPLIHKNRGNQQFNACFHDEKESHPISRVFLEYQFKCFIFFFDDLHHWILNLCDVRLPLAHGNVMLEMHKIRRLSLFHERQPCNVCITCGG